MVSLQQLSYLFALECPMEVAILALLGILHTRKTTSLKLILSYDLRRVTHAKIMGTLHRQRFPPKDK